MKRSRQWITWTGILALGLAAGWSLNSRTPVFAGGSSDRFKDYILATGPVNEAFSNNAAFLNAELDGVWLLDYNSGKLLASTLNRQTGKMVGWAEMDLVKEFEIAPRTDVHFLMTTGTVVKGQSVLYLLEMTSGKVGVYSMMPAESPAGNPNGMIVIRRHDMTMFRGPAAQQQTTVIGQPVMQSGLQAPNMNQTIPNLNPNQLPR